MKMNIRNQLALLCVLICCVLSFTNAQFRVLDGAVIDIKDSPHSVAIFDCNIYKCVGALVSDTSVVTAAHCVERSVPFNVAVLAGVTHLYKEKGQRIFAMEIHVHPEYDRKNKYMDIAVVKMRKSFEENDAVKPIKLCEEEGTLRPGLPLKVSGWGLSNEETEDHSPLLKTTTVEIAQCRDLDVPAPNILAETLIFAGVTGEDLSYGDSGAAGVWNGRLCAVAHNIWVKYPGIFIDVTHPLVQNFLKSKI